MYADHAICSKKLDTRYIISHTWVRPSNRENLIALGQRVNITGTCPKLYPPQGAFCQTHYSVLGDFSGGYTWQTFTFITPSLLLVCLYTIFELYYDTIVI